MSPPRGTSAAGAPRRRADADRSVAAILAAALDALASDPDASMAEIARGAGVVRATIYVHFPTRDALIAAVTERAIDEVTRAIVAADPPGGDPSAALARVLAAAWRGLGRFHALVALNVRLPPAELNRRHEPVIALLAPLIARGQQDGTFRADVPAAWHLATIMALVHAASGELQAGRLAATAVEPALIDTVLGALGPVPR